LGFEKSSEGENEKEKGTKKSRGDGLTDFLFVHPYLEIWQN